MTHEALALRCSFNMLAAQARRRATKVSARTEWKFPSSEGGGSGNSLSLSSLHPKVSNRLLEVMRLQTDTARAENAFTMNKRKGKQKLVNVTRR